MPVNSRGERVNTHKQNNQNNQKAQAQALRKPKQSTGGTIGSSVGGAA